MAIQPKTMNALTRLNLTLREAQLRQRIQTLVAGSETELLSTADLATELGSVIHALEEANEYPAQAKSALASLEVRLAQLEAQQRQTNTHDDMPPKFTLWIAGRNLLIFSAVAWLLLLISNWLSMLSVSYTWPVGWFANDYYTVFAAVGVTLNALFAQLRSAAPTVWSKGQSSLYVFRLLQATVYAALLYHLASVVLPEADIACTATLCVSLQSPLLLISSFLIGLLVSEIEKGILWNFEFEQRSQRRSEREQQLRVQHRALLNLYSTTIAQPDNHAQPDELLAGRFRRAQKAVDFNLPQKANAMLLGLELEIHKLANAPAVENVPAIEGDQTADVHVDQEIAPDEPQDALEDEPLSENSNASVEDRDEE